MRNMDVIAIGAAFCACVLIPISPVLAVDADIATALAWQIALDRSGFSPGVIDGSAGAKTFRAVREFQQARGLAVTGQFDSATSVALGVDTANVLTRYTVTPQDIAAVGPFPNDWNRKAQLKRLDCESLEALLGERFHCTVALLRSLNGGGSLANLRAGETITVPSVSEAPACRAARLEINLDEKIVRAFDGAGRQVGMLHCSVAANQSDLPRGESRIVVISHNPTYMFDPAKWPEVKNVRRKLLIPPGPRNPVGLCWIGLSIPSYGIHGTPQPEMIGKTGSHGCIRLTNWDAIRLSKMVEVGAPVKFVSALQRSSTRTTPSAKRRQFD